MNETDQPGELPQASAKVPNAPISRRTLLVGGAGATAVGIAGLTAGIAVGAHEVPRVPRSVSSRQRFANKVVMITGATSGIGRAAAIAFAREGARVAFCGRREALGLNVEREIRDKGGTARYFRADVRLEADVQRFQRNSRWRSSGASMSLSTMRESRSRSRCTSTRSTSGMMFFTRIFAACSSP